MLIINVFIGGISDIFHAKISGSIHKIVRRLVGLGGHDMVMIEADMIFVIHQFELNMDDVGRLPHLGVNAV